jgi:DNA-binding HxlR family transcriptional regulator
MSLFLPLTIINVINSRPYLEAKMLICYFFYLDFTLTLSSPKKQLLRFTLGQNECRLDIMATKRSYEDGCAAAHALDLIGERWALLVVRELLLGPKRFTDLRASLPGISSNVLTQRLSELEEGAVVQKRKLGPPVSTWVYELTDWGKELEPVIIQLGCWAAKSPCFFPGAAISATSLALSFRAMFNPDHAKNLNAHYELRLGDEHFHAEIADGCFHITRGNATQVDVMIEAAPNHLAAVVYGGQNLNEAIQSGDVHYQGDPSLMERFLTLFSLPQPVRMN